MKKFDDTYRTEEKKLIAGVDEAGRGPLAGPVVAAAVVLPPELALEGVDDSKKLTPAKREELFSVIQKEALSIAYEIIAPDVIDEINILQATLLAMKNSVNKLVTRPQLILIDGNKSFASKIPALPIIKGDGKSLSIAAASIVAKVVRDRIMIDLSKEYAGYLWEKNKGYGTREHITALRKLGPTPLHRKTFLRKIFYYEQYKII